MVKNLVIKSPNTLGYIDKSGTPLVFLRLFDILKRRNVFVTARVDTRFTGSIIIPSEIYLGLRLQMFEEPMKEVVGKLSTGVIIGIRSSKAIVEIGDRSTSCDVYTIPSPIQASIGLELIKTWKIKLDWINKKVTINST